MYTYSIHTVCAVDVNASRSTHVSYRVVFTSQTWGIGILFVVGYDNPRYLGTQSHNSSLPERLSPLSPSLSISPSLPLSLSPSSAAGLKCGRIAPINIPTYPATAPPIYAATAPPICSNSAINSLTGLFGYFLRIEQYAVDKARRTQAHSIDVIAEATAQPHIVHGDVAMRQPNHQSWLPACHHRRVEESLWKCIYRCRFSNRLQNYSSSSSDMVSYIR